MVPFLEALGVPEALRGELSSAQHKYNYTTANDKEIRFTETNLTKPQLGSKDQVQLVGQEVEIEGLDGMKMKVKVDWDGDKLKELYRNESFEFSSVREIKGSEMVLKSYIKDLELVEIYNKE